MQLLQRAKYEVRFHKIDGKIDSDENKEDNATAYFAVQR